MKIPAIPKCLEAEDFKDSLNGLQSAWRQMKDLSEEAPPRAKKVGEQILNDTDISPALGLAEELRVGIVETRAKYRHHRATCELCKEILKTCDQAVTDPDVADHSNSNSKLRLPDPQNVE